VEGFSANQKTATWATITTRSIDFSNFGEIAKHDKLVFYNLMESFDSEKMPTIKVIAH